MGADMEMKKEPLAPPHDQIFQQLLGDGGNVADRLFEKLGVDPGWLTETADLAHVLESRSSNLFLSSRRVRVPEGLDASTHEQNLASDPR